jgi:two-component system, NtrC family, response regulator AtoC
MATPVPSTLADGGRSLVDAGRAYHLTVMGPDVFETRPLPTRGELVIGRGRGADVPIDEPRASRRHARLRVGPGAAFEVEDLGSANGTRVRGRRVEPGRAVAIAPGEAIAIGALVLMVQADSADRAVSSLATRASQAPEGLPTAAVVCVEDSMRRLYALAKRAGAGTIGVVILGETGVGKDVLARAIHDQSPRAARPFVSVNCAAISESLLESELFGHERGAFTGAAQAKAGLLETAPGGTVFLDEVGELTLAVQAKLLRVIETRELVRVGGVRAQKLDVRFIAATNRDLEADVARGAFRRDLYYRLNGMTLTIPPLRERPRDLPLLARHFVVTLAKGAGRARPPTLTDGALARLAGHAWPGNVRELRNVVERALLLADGPALTEEHLAIEIARAPVPQPPASAPLTEQDRIVAALAACGGNQSRAAKQLGISRKVFVARLETYGVVRPRKRARP